MNDSANMVPSAVQPAPEMEIPVLPPDATPEQKDAHWYRYVYQGDRMPQLTLRAVLMGGFLGMIMSASNLYTTLTVGWSFGVTITACVMSYVIWSMLRLISGGRISEMSVLENNCMASTASAAGASTGATIATMFGSLLLLTLPEAGKGSETVRTFQVQPWWLVGAFTLLTALMGVFLAIPMKRQMINHERLPFPTGIATAETLRSLYSRSRTALHKAYALIGGLIVGAILGILKADEGQLAFLDRAFNWIQKHAFNVRVPGLVPAKGFYQIKETGGSLYGFGWEPSLLLVGAGMITGVRVCLSMLFGSALLYLVFTPMLIRADIAAQGNPSHVVSIILAGSVYKVNGWSLWGGTAVMVFSSLTALALQWKTIARAFTGALGGRSTTSQHADDLARIEVPGSWMIMGMVPITIGMLLVQILAFKISWYAGLIAIAMSFVLSLVASRATGETDTTPIGAMGKVMQLMFAVLAPTKIHVNLAAAGIAANSASSSADLLTDLKSGYVLGANPRRQFLAQFFGVFFGTLAIVPIWYLMVPTRAALEKFPAPATQMWYGVAKALTEGLKSLPVSARYAIVVGALVGVALPLLETLVPTKYRKYYPSAMGLGLSWVIPFSNALSFAIGAVFAWAWSKVRPKAAEMFNVPLASGFVAGQSLLQAVTAITATVIDLLNKK